MDYLSDWEKGEIKEGLSLLLAKRKAEHEDAFFYYNTDEISEDEYTDLGMTVYYTELLINKIDDSMSQDKISIENKTT